MIKISETFSLKLDFSIQQSPMGRPIRLSSISKYEEVPEKWIDRKLKNWWLYTFRFMDDKDGYVSFLFNYEDKFVRTIK